MRRSVPIVLVLGSIAVGVAAPSTTPGEAVDAGACSTYQGAARGDIGSSLPARPAAAGSAGQSVASRSGADEPIQRKLLRTLQVGLPQEIDVEEILAYARGSEADYTGHVLARSALLVLGEDQGFPDWPVERLLERTLAQLQRESAAYAMPAGMEPGFGPEHLVMAVVYAMVMAGEAERAVEVLRAQVDSGSDFKRAVALQALRYIGTDDANGVVQRASDADNVGNLLSNLLADHYYPFLVELQRTAEQLPRPGRHRAGLLDAARQGCGRRASLAVYFLGFLAAAEDPRQETEELALLRALTGAGRGCFYTRFFAIRSLALRSPETIAFWTSLYRAEQDAWQRAQLARIGFARFGRQFLGPALELLAAEPVQYVQWELMHGNIEVREGAEWRPYWDLWLPPTLQFRLDFPRRAGAMPTADLDALLTWLEEGARPLHPWVYNHMLYGMARHVEGAATRRLLRVFDTHPTKAENWWILAPLDDAAALPLLRYWAGLDAVRAQREELGRLIDKLDASVEGGGARATAAGESALLRPDAGVSAGSGDRHRPAAGTGAGDQERGGRTGLAAGRGSSRSRADHRVPRLPAAHRRGVLGGPPGRRALGAPFRLLAASRGVVGASCPPTQLRAGRQWGTAAPIVMTLRRHVQPRFGSVAAAPTSRPDSLVRCWHGFIAASKIVDGMTWLKDDEVTDPGDGQRRVQSCVSSCACVSAS